MSHKQRTWQGFKIWLGFFALTALAVELSMRYADRPISIFVAKSLGSFRLAEKLTDTPSFFIPISLLVFGIFLWRRFAAEPLAKLDTACLLAGVSLLVTNLVNDALKLLFGRTWPQYLFPSFIGQGAYGFHPFHHGYGYKSFPSGHAAAVCALLSVAWQFYPRFRSLYAFTAVSFSTLLVVMNFHFLADVIAGAFLGFSTGFACCAVWYHLSPRGRSVESD
jgi:membrane-associated phospholipid phosphatase